MDEYARSFFILVAKRANTPPTNIVQSARIISVTFHERSASNKVIVISIVP